MEKPRVFVLGRISKAVEDYLRSQCEVDIWPQDQIDKAELERRLATAQGVLIRATTPVDEAFLNAAPNLRVISNRGVGYNNFKIDDLRARKILATNTPGTLDDSVADLAIGLMLAAGRRIAYFDRFVKEKRWDRSRPEAFYYGLDLHHKTLGVIGMGRIGAKAARRAHLGFDMNILYYDVFENKSAQEELGATRVSFDELLGQSDYVLMFAALTKENRNMMSTREFSLMKPTAIFVNSSRGPLVDEAALYEALKNNTIAGAAIDVYEKEPVSQESPLLTLDNIVTLPHLGSSTAETREKMGMLAAENAVRVLYGQPGACIIPELRDLV
jgi:gluconate 2-dehydrogenase